MIEFVYVERDVIDHPRVEAIRRRLSRAQWIEIDRYGEVFNRKAQDFRLQKLRPALILARKFDRHVLEAPSVYGLGGRKHYYFSHMLNCLYDCRYCFLQGMYRSAHYVLFVNYEDFFKAIEERAGSGVYFFSGYDCDSLALDGISSFVPSFLPLFEVHRDSILELRTKSARIKPLLERSPMDNVVVAYSLSPSPVAERLEHRAPSLEERLKAARTLGDKGWKLGLRFDPLIDHEGGEEAYATLFSRVFAALDPATVHSVTLGPFRLPHPFYRTMESLYPEEPLFAAGLVERAGIVSYGAERENALRHFCEDELRRYVPSEGLFSYEVES